MFLGEGFSFAGARRQQPGAKRTRVCSKGLGAAPSLELTAASGTARKDESSGDISSLPNVLWEKIWRARYFRFGRD